MRVMSFLSDPLNLVFILVAVFAGFRLWRVLGLRTGAEPVVKVQPTRIDPKPSDLELKPAAPPKPAWEGVAEETSELGQALQQIAGSAPGFTGAAFLQNSISAHEHIMEAFAAGNTAALKPLLNDPTFKIFEAEIKRRHDAGEKHEFRFVSPEKAALRAARVTGQLASLDVAFTSQVISATKDKNGKVLSGDDRRIVTLKEVWTFERALGPGDSTWQLADTRDDD
jgi:predicted lipid-binding transport protein (Tim44 family)